MGPLSGTSVGTTPNISYTGWDIQRSFRDVTDGLSNSLLAGDKYVHPLHIGEGRGWGDHSFYNDDSRICVARNAGPGIPIVRSPQDPTITLEVARRSFGSYHRAGVCQFVLGDGSVRAIEPSINTTLLGWLANIRDGQVIKSF